jgi:uncharacterized protein (TIGR02646 family)
MLHDMIHVSRDLVRIPPALLAKAKRHTEELMKQLATLGPQQRPEFRFELMKEFKPYLLDLFHHKCAYCESPIVAQHGDIALFRPKSAYPWLAYRWDNMLIACQMCNQAYKANRFPLLPKTKRATNETELSAEQPMLLNPCEDNPEEHLEFDDAGTVLPLTKRGEATLAELGLNREELREYRGRTAKAVLTTCKLRSSVLDAATEHVKSDIEKLIESQIDTQAPFTAMARAIIRRHSLRFLAPVESGQVKHIRTEAKMSGYIRQIEVRNFRSLENVCLKFDWVHESSSQVRWQVLLGENGVGKSSVLQAMALAASGGAGFKVPSVNAFCNPQRILRKQHDSKRRPASGLIRVWMSKSAEPVEIHFNQSQLRFSKGEEGLQTFVRAYGATRLLPRKGSVGADEQPPGAAIANLFDPFQPLCDVDGWLSNLSQQAFDKVALTLKDVLQVQNSQNITLYRDRDKIRATDARGVMVEIDALSQGQRATLVLTCDILSGIMHFRKSCGDEPIPPGPDDFRSTEGIVFLDEIDAHLHPRWKMEIVRSLKNAFPRIQFICATHEPLCLRGLGEKEIVLMNRAGDMVTAEIAEESPAGMRVDQLLTSRLFGLHSTIDPEIDSQFAEYYSLLAKPEQQRSMNEKRRLELLKKMLLKHNRLGYTRRDQLVYEIIDECLALEAQEEAKDKRHELREETKQKVRDIWARVGNRFES